LSIGRRYWVRSLNGDGRVWHLAAGVHQTTADTVCGLEGIPQQATAWPRPMPVQSGPICAACIGREVLP